MGSLLRTVIGVAWLIAGTVSLAQTAQAGAGGRTPTPSIKIDRAKAEKCVEPTDVMRKSHMSFILHQRDETMHRGVRTSKHSLVNCINCHADSETGTVLGKDGFCQSCHEYAAVSIDCFQCHNPKAQPASSGGMNPPAAPGIALRAAPPSGSLTDAARTGPLP